MAEQPSLDNWGRYLLAAGLGGGLMLLFIFLGLNPAFLGAGWLVAVAGWLLGRASGNGPTPQFRP
jgi:hypothetical protein